MYAETSPVARILAVEDDLVLAGHVRSFLEKAGHAVTLSHDGCEGLRLAERDDYDLVLMDILLPGLDGLQLLQQLRRHSRVPVLLMSALGGEQNRIAGFSRGADDYLPKPFSVAELGVRVEAILRRVAYERQVLERATCEGELAFDEFAADVRWAGQSAGLTASEYRVLELLWQHHDQVLSKPFLYQQALRRGYSRHDRALDMHVSHIRRKLQAIGCTGMRLETVWGQGYTLVCVAP